MTASDHNSAPAVTPSRILVMFPTAGRDGRLAQVDRGECPEEFFYGSLRLRERGADIVYGDSRKEPAGLMNRAYLLGERARNRVANFGLSRQRVVALRDEIVRAAAAISFVDGFSISLGRYTACLDCQTRLIGGFHGLADMVDEVRPVFRRFVYRQIREAVAGLDHLFFFGEVDRQEAIRRYDIPAAKTSLFLFGVDGKFWCPADDAAEETYVGTVGSDSKRDYPTLVAAPIDNPLRIITTLPVSSHGGDVEVIRGNYAGSPITEPMLRDFYRAASVIVVPVRDVFQPSGYSVTLQAMACGKPVVLSRNKGLWDPDVFKSGENCMLVEPGNPAALGDAVNRLAGDIGLRKRIGVAARETAVAHFGLDRMNASLERLTRRA